MSGTTPASTSRYYQVYFDSTDFPKTAPVYLTDLAWNGSTTRLSNTTIQATLNSVSNRSGISTFSYNGFQYTGGSGLGYIASSSNAFTYAELINGPVKKTIRITPATNGYVSYTLYDRAEFVKAEGNVTGSSFSGFTMFPYLQDVNSAVLSSQFHYYDGGAVVNEVAGSQGWLNGKPDEGWACYDGQSTYKDLCLVTNAATLATSNNFWRYSSSQVMFPAWNPNPAFPIQPVSYVVMADTYQDGRDFWNKLAAPITQDA